MLEQGAFEALGPRSASVAAYIGIGAQPVVVEAPLEKSPPDVVLAELSSLVSSYLDANTGFTARRAVAKERFEGDFDQLARFGEWDLSMPPKKERLR